MLLNTEVTEDLLKKVSPDAIIVATGAKPLMPPIKGIDGTNVITAEDALLGKCDIGVGPCVVCGGGEVGGETAHFLAERNHDVTVLEMQDDILNDMMPFTKRCLVEMLEAAKVKVHTGAKVTEIKEKEVLFVDSKGNEQSIPADSVVSAFGYKAYDPLEEIAKANCKEVYMVGGAIKAGNAIIATKEGYEKS